MSDYSGTARPHGLEVRWKIWGDLNDRDLHNVQAFMDDFFAIWKPRPTRGFKTPVDYATLAYARQCFDLAGDAADMHVSDQFFYLDALRQAMEQLERVEPRFVYAHSLARYAAQLAGEFDIEDAMDGAWDELRTVMPQPLTRPIPGVTEYAIVDDTQSPADFDIMRLPDPDTFSVRIGSSPPTNSSAKDARCFHWTWSRRTPSHWPLSTAHFPSGECLCRWTRTTTARSCHTRSCAMCASASTVTWTAWWAAALSLIHI